jgi:hypothetical protein
MATQASACQPILSALIGGLARQDSDAQNREPSSAQQPCSHRTTRLKWQAQAEL